MGHSLTVLAIAQGLTMVQQQADPLPIHNGLVVDAVLRGGKGNSAWAFCSITRLTTESGTNHVPTMKFYK